MPVKDFVATETRFAILQRTNPDRAAELALLAQADVDERRRFYEQLAGIHRSVPHIEEAELDAASEMTAPRTNREDQA